MPTKRFSTRSMRPTALRPPISFSSSTSDTGSSAWPPTETGTPFSNPISTCSSLSGASCGAFVNCHVLGNGALPASSSSPPSWLMCQRLRSRLWIFARFQVPLAPRRHNLQLWSERLVGHFEAHLVVAFAGATVADGRCSFAQRDLDLMFRDHRASERRAEQILILIHCARFQRRPDVAGKELFARVFHHNLAGSSFVGLIDDSFNVVSLAYVGA